MKRYVHRHYEFQFQSGSIKTVRPLVRTEHHAEFQFQSGSIKTFLQNRFKVGNFLVSIPIWFD